MAARARIQQLRDTAAGWAANNFVLMAGEIGVELDTGLQKVGNGVQGWNDRPYQRGPIGPAGPVGATGAKGNTGNTGAQGVKGDTGAQGVKGDQGAGLQLAGQVQTYAQLPTSGVASGAGFLVVADGLVYIWSGAAWPANGAGVQLRGIKGDTGAQGIPGVKGDTGAIGPKGDTGAQGPAGTSPSNVVTSTTVTSLVHLTQAQYDALGVKVTTTLYVIVG